MTAPRSASECKVLIIESWFTRRSPVGSSDLLDASGDDDTLNFRGSGGLLLLAFAAGSDAPGELTLGLTSAKHDRNASSDSPSAKATPWAKQRI